jgi:NAD(P)-dependent dehydrogenase (short-subunit alcohol dehydrogenase family)
VTDVTDKSSVERLADQAWSRFGAVHIVFNNAGVAVFGPTQSNTHADWQWIMNVNVWGPIHGVEAFVPRMIEQKQGGHVLFTASFAGLVSNRGLGPYSSPRLPLSRSPNACPRICTTTASAFRCSVRCG